MKTVMKFSASWCGPCRMMKPIFNQIKEKYKDANLEFKEIEIDASEDNEELADKYNIRQVPTFLLCNDADEYARISGAVSFKDFDEWIQRNT